MREGRESAASNGGWVARIAEMQDRKSYSEQHWEGSFEDYLDIVRRESRGDAHRLPAPLRHDPVAREEEYIDNKKRLVRYNFFDDPIDGGRDAIFGLDIPLMRLVNVFKSAAQRLRHREARPPAARPGRLVQVHHRAPAEEGPGGVLAHARRARSTPSTGTWSARPRAAAAPRRCMPCPMHEEPLHLIPPEWRERGLRRARPPADERLSRSPIDGRPLPGLPPDLPGADDRSTSGDWAKVRAARARAAAHPLREGPRRHRHLPAQGREEPGLDRADRRHQLPQDRRVRLRLRPARLQLRRRVQHRQPRHHRVHRDPQARRGLPLRPARRDAGAQDQAEEVRADRHRRGHHRPHQRARVQEAPEQRVHGGAPRPHGQDRHPVHHRARRGGQDLREGLQRAARSAASTSRRTRSRWPRCGRCSPGSRSRRRPT